MKKHGYQNYEPIQKPNLTLRMRKYCVIFVNEYKNRAIKGKNEVI